MLGLQMVTLLGYAYNDRVTQKNKRKLFVVNKRMPIATVAYQLPRVKFVHVMLIQWYPHIA